MDRDKDAEKVIDKFRKKAKEKGLTNEETESLISEALFALSLVVKNPKQKNENKKS